MLCVQVPWSACDKVLVYRCHDQIVTRFMCAGTTVRLWWGLYAQVQKSLWSGGGQDISAGLRWSHDRQNVSHLNCTTSSDTLLSLRQSSPSNSKGEKCMKLEPLLKRWKGWFDDCLLHMCRIATLQLCWMMFSSISDICLDQFTVDFFSSFKKNYTPKLHNMHTNVAIINHVLNSIYI